MGNMIKKKRTQKRHCKTGGMIT